MVNLFNHRTKNQLELELSLSLLKGFFLSINCCVYPSYHSYGTISVLFSCTSLWFNYIASEGFFWAWRVDLY